MPWPSILRRRRRSTPERTRRRLQEHRRRSKLDGRQRRPDQHAMSGLWPSILRLRPRSTPGTERRRRLQEHQRRSKLGGRQRRPDQPRCLGPGHRSFGAGHALAGTRRRRLQEHQRRSKLDGRQRRPDQHQCLSPGHRSFGSGHALRGTAAAASSRAPTAGEAGRPSTPASPTRIVLALAIDPSLRPRSTPARLGGVFKSTNGGAKLDGRQHRPDRSYVSALAIDPSAPATLYAGTDDSAAFSRAPTAVESWTAVNAGLTNRCPRPGH